MKYQINTYDVWGNEEDGFEVNDVYHAGECDLPDDATDEQIIQALKDCGFLKGSANVGDVEIGGDDELITLNEADTGKPFCELVRAD